MKYFGQITAPNKAHVHGNFEQCGGDSPAHPTLWHVCKDINTPNRPHSSWGVSPVTPVLAKSVTLHLIPILATLSCQRRSLRLCGCTAHTWSISSCRAAHTLNPLWHQLQYLTLLKVKSIHINKHNECCCSKDTHWYGLHDEMILTYMTCNMHWNQVSPWHFHLEYKLIPDRICECAMRKNGHFITQSLPSMSSKLQKKQINMFIFLFFFFLIWSHLECFLGTWWSAAFWCPCKNRHFKMYISY